VIARHRRDRKTNGGIDGGGWVEWRLRVSIWECEGRQTLACPAQQSCTNGKASAYGGDQDEVALFEAALLAR
jgi:hypothetical protein